MIMQRFLLLSISLIWAFSKGYLFSTNAQSYLAKNNSFTADVNHMLKVRILEAEGAPFEFRKNQTLVTVVNENNEVLTYDNGEFTWQHYSLADGMDFFSVPEGDKISYEQYYGISTFLRQYYPEVDMFVLFRDSDDAPTFAIDGKHGVLGTTSNINKPDYLALHSLDQNEKKRDESEDTPQPPPPREEASEDYEGYDDSDTFPAPPSEDVGSESHGGHDHATSPPPPSKDAEDKSRKAHDHVNNSHEESQESSGYIESFSSDHFEDDSEEKHPPKKLATKHESSHKEPEEKPHKLPEPEKLEEHLEEFKEQQETIQDQLKRAIKEAQEVKEIQEKTDQMKKEKEELQEKHKEEIEKMKEEHEAEKKKIKEDCKEESSEKSESGSSSSSESGSSSSSEETHGKPPKKQKIRPHRRHNKRIHTARREGHGDCSESSPVESDCTQGVYNAFYGCVYPIQIQQSNMPQTPVQPAPVPMPVMPVPMSAPRTHVPDQESMKKAMRSLDNLLGGKFDAGLPNPLDCIPSPVLSVPQAQPQVPQIVYPVQNKGHRHHQHHHRPHRGNKHRHHPKPQRRHHKAKPVSNRHTQPLNGTMCPGYFIPIGNSKNCKAYMQSPMTR